MPRQARLLPDRGMFHLIGRGNNGIKVFRNKFDFLRFKETLIRFLSEVLSIKYYALMHTHFHILAWLENTENLAKAMKSALVSYQHYYHCRYGYKGHLWHGRFRSIIIKSDEQMLQCARYIELNPVYAGICSRPDEYPWTSYHYHALGKTDSLINVNCEVLEGTAWKENVQDKGYADFVSAGINLDYQYLKKQFEQERANTSRASLFSKIKK